MDSSITLFELYEWVDRGFIGLADVHVDTYTAHHLVTFTRRVDLIWAVNKLSGSTERIFDSVYHETSLSGLKSNPAF